MLTAAVLLAVIVVPGIGLCLAAGPVAGRWLLATAPALSILLLGWAGWLAGRVAVSPSPVTLLLLATGLGLAAGAALRALPPRWPRQGRPAAAGSAGRPLRAAAGGPGPASAPRRPVSTLAAAAAGVVAAVAVTVALWNRPPRWAQQVPNYWDSTWHGYLLAVVARTGNADVSSLLPLDPQLPGWVDYYPAGWHIPVATAVRLTGASIPVGYNVGQLLFASVVLSVGTVALVRVLGLRSRLVLLLAPVLVAVAYPVQARLVDTVSFDAALALLPAALAALVAAARSGWGPAPTLLAGAVAAGVFQVQPSVVVALGIIAACLVVARACSPATGRSWPAVRGALLGLGGWVLATAVLALPWLVASTSHAMQTLDYSRPNQVPYLEALRTLFVEYPPMSVAPTLPVVVALATVVLVVDRTYRWMVVAAAIFAGVYVAAYSAPAPWRQVVSGFWYTDWYRPGGVFWLLAVLMVAAAVDSLGRRLSGRAPHRVLAAGTATVLAVALAAAVPVWVAAARTRLKHLEGRPGLVTQSDRAGFAYLAAHVPPGERVLNDWSDGSGWMYALDGVDPLIATVGSNHDPDRVWLVQHFDELGTNPRVAALLARYRISYVYTDPTRDSVADYRLRLPTTGLTPVFSKAGTRVYRIDTTPSR